MPIHVSMQETVWSRRSSYNIRILPPNEVECFGISFRILNQNIHNQLDLSVFGCQVSRLLVVSALATHRDRCIEIELEVTW